MIRFAAINSSPDGGSKRPKTRTKGKDALEAENFALYEKALHHQYAGEYQDAEKLYKNILTSPLIVLNETVEVSQRDDIYYTLPVVTLQYLAYKNFASLCEATSRKTEALEYYAKALDVDGRDVVVWYQMALLCVAVGRLQLARFALEQGLKATPDHWLSVDKLAEVQFILGDYGACMNSVDKMLEMEPNYNKAILLKAKILEENPENKFKVEALLWEAGVNSMDVGKVDELVQARHKRQKVADYEYQGPAVVPPKEFVLKETTWNAFADLLYSIYKDMADEKKSNFLNDPIHITTPNLPPTPTESPITTPIINEGSNSNLPSPPQPSLNTSTPALLTSNITGASDSNSNFPPDTNTNPGTADLNSSSSGLGTQDVEMSPAEPARPKFPRGKKAAAARQSSRVKESKTEKVATELDEFISKLLSWKDETANGTANSTAAKNESDAQEEHNSNPTPPAYTIEDEKKQVALSLVSLQARTPALRGVVDWISAFLGEICERSSHNWGPALAAKIMGLQAIANRHSTWFKKYFLTLAELHFDAHVCNVTSIGHHPAPTFTPALHLAEHGYYSSQIFTNGYDSFGAPYQIRALWLKAIGCIHAEEIPMAMECMEGCKKLLTEHKIDVVWVAHCTHNRSITVSGIDRKIKEISGLNTVSAATDLFNRENYQQVVSSLQPVAHSFTEFALEEPDGKAKDVNSSKRNRLRIYDLLHQSHLKLKEFKNAFWCLERMLIELLPHYNMPEMQGNIQSLLDYVLATEKFAKTNQVPLSTFDLSKLKRGIAILVKRSTSPAMVLHAVKVFYEMHSEQMTLGQKIVLMHLTHAELSKRKACYQQDGGKFLRRYMSFLVPLVFPNGSEEASTDDWNLLTDHRINVDHELAQCFCCIYGIKLHPNIDDHPQKNQQPPKTSKEVMLLFLLVRHIYQEFKQKPPKETKDALTKLYTSFKEPPARVTPLFKDIERYLNDTDTLPQQTIKDLKATHDDRAANAHLALGSWKANPDEITEDTDLKDLASNSDCDFIYGELYFMISLNYTEADAAFEEVIKKDLYCNPWRIESWVSLGMLYVNKLGVILEQDSVYFPYQPALVPPVANLNKLSDRCLSQAIELDGSREDLWKVLGLLLYQQHKTIILASYPLFPPAPLSPSTTTATQADNSNGSGNSNSNSNDLQVPESSEITQKRHELVARVYERSAKCFRRAGANNPKEWLYPYMLGKISEKCNKPLTEFLTHYRAGAELRRKEEPEPLYRLHASRLKFLLKNKKPSASEMDELEQFNSIIPDLNADPEPKKTEVENYHALINDCLAGMEECKNDFKWFHKSTYMVSYTLKHGPNPDTQAAQKNISSLFKPMSNNFWYIWEKKGTEIPPGKKDQYKIKYAKLYIELLEDNADKGALENCLTKIKREPKMVPTGVVDLAFSAFCRVQAIAIQNLSESLKNAATLPPPDPTPTVTQQTPQDDPTSTSPTTTTTSSAPAASTPTHLESLEKIILNAWETHTEAASKPRAFQELATPVLEQAFKLYITYCPPETPLDDSTSLLHQATQFCEKKFPKGRRRTDAKLGDAKKDGTVRRRRKADSEKPATSESSTSDSTTPSVAEPTAPSAPESAPEDMETDSSRAPSSATFA